MMIFQPLWRWHFFQMGPSCQSWRSFSVFLFSMIISGLLAFTALSVFTGISQSTVMLLYFVTVWGLCSYHLSAFGSLYIAFISSNGCHLLPCHASGCILSLLVMDGLRLCGWWSPHTHCTVYMWDLLHLWWFWESMTDGLLNKNKLCKVQPDLQHRQGNKGQQTRYYHREQTTEDMRHNWHDCPIWKKYDIKEVEKWSKYKDMEIEITRMWGIKVTAIPVVIGALSVIKKGRERRILLQKNVLLESARIIWKALFIS